MGLIISQSDALSYASFEDDRFSSIQGHVITLTNLIMAETVIREAEKIGSNRNLETSDL